MGGRLSSYEHRSVKRVTAVLSAIGGAGQPLRLVDLSRAVELDPATTYRIVSCLVREGFVHKNPVTRRYTIGFEVLRYGSAEKGRALAAERAHRFLARIALELAATVIIGSRQGRAVFLHERVPGPYQARIPFDIAQTRYVDAHATAIGKVLLAFAPRAEVAGLYAGAPLPRHTARTLRSTDALMAELAQIRRTGFARERDELAAGLAGIAVPVYNPLGDVNLAAWIQCPSEQLDRLASTSVAARVQATLADFIVYATGREPLSSAAGRALLETQPRTASLATAGPPGPGPGEREDDGLAATLIAPTLTPRQEGTMRSRQGLSPTAEPSGNR